MSHAPGKAGVDTKFGGGPQPPAAATALPRLILAYGAGTMVSQVLVLRELLVLAQGSELKLALGLWCWLLWTGLGSLWGGRGGRPGGRQGGPQDEPEAGTGQLSSLLVLLGLLLPATVLLIRALPALGLLPWGQSLPLGTALWLFLAVLSPFGLVSGYFFPCACRALTAQSPGAPGRVYYLETLGAALGVLVLQLLLLDRFSGLALSLATGFLLSLSPWILVRPPARRGPAAIIGAAGLLLLAGACLFLPRLETWSLNWQWPGRQVVAAAESPYARLVATREAEQTSFFANGLWQFTYPDPLSAEHQVQFGMLEHPRPRRVLLLGGGPGLVPEILKHPGVTHLDYVELDPKLVRLALELLPEAGAAARDPRVQIVYQDARRFLETPGRRYDVILMALPEPKNAQLNRFYSREFFQVAAARLTPGGVFTFALAGAETSLHPLRAAYLAMTYHTLGRVFPEVAVLPGERARFLAAARSGTLSADPAVLAARLQERGLELHYVRDYYLLSDLSRPRREYLRQTLNRLPVELNTDLEPGCYFYDLALSAIQEGVPANRALLYLRRLSPVMAGSALVAGLLLPGLLLRRRPGALCLYQVTVMGLGVMALEILVLILYQIRFGYLYRHLGMLIAAFMVGMAAGSRALQSRGAPGGLGSVAALQGALAALAALLALWLACGFSYPWPEWVVQAAYALLLTAGGFAGGGIFASAADLWAREGREAGAAGGFLYAADLLGATLGTLGISLMVLPAWGVLTSLYLIAALHAGAALLLLGRR